MELYGALKMASYVCLQLVYFTAAYMVYRLFQKGRIRVKPRRFINLNLQRLLVSPNIEASFESSGYPLALTAWKFQMIRYSLFAVWMISISYDIVAKYEVIGPLTILVKVLGPLLLLLLTNTKASLVTYILSKWKEIYDGEKNRELFMIYNMIADELKEAKHRKLNLKTLLTKLKDYSQRIKPSINQGLRVFDEGAQVALLVIGRDIGTKEALEICKLIADLEMAKPEDVSDLVAAREDSYTNLLRDNRKRRRKFFGHVAYGIAFSPLLIYLWNALSIAQEYVSELSKNTNNFS